MIERAKATDAADIIEQHDDPEYFDLGRQCIELDGQHFCAAAQFMLGVRGTGAGQTIAMFLGLGKGGLHLQHTVHGARQLAASLIAMADQIDAQQTEQARTMLAATLGKDATGGI